MISFQNMMNTFLQDVNKEDSLFIQFAERTTDFLFYLIKWAGIPFIAYVLYMFLKI